jgi:hypothetical protein
MCFVFIHGRVNSKRAEKIQRFRRNEAAIIIQRNFAPKYMAASVYRVSMQSLKTSRGYCEAAADIVELDIFECQLVECVDQLTDMIGTNMDLVYHDSMQMINEQISEDLINECALLVAPLWLEDQMRAMEEANRRIAEEREHAEENLRRLMKEEEQRALEEQRRLEEEALMIKAEHDRKALEDAQAESLEKGEVFVPFADETDPNYNLSDATKDFIESITNQVFTKMFSVAVLSQMLADVQKRPGGSEADESVGKMSLVSFGDENNPDFDFEASANNFVGKISAKIVSRQSSPKAAMRAATIMNDAHELDTGGDKNLLDSLDKDSLMTTSVADYVNDITAAGVTRVVLSRGHTPLLLPRSEAQGEDGGAVLTNAKEEDEEPFSGSNAAGIADILGESVASTSVLPDEKKQPADTCDAEEQLVTNDEMQNPSGNAADAVTANDSEVPADEGCDEDAVVFLNVDAAAAAASSSKSVNAAQPLVWKSEPPLSVLRALFMSELLSNEQKINLEEAFTMAYQLYCAGKYVDSLELLDDAEQIVQNFHDQGFDTNPHFILIGTSLKVLYIRNLMALAQYLDVKKCIEEVLERIQQVFGADSAHAAELLLLLADLHRALGNYNDSEVHFFHV